MATARICRAAERGQELTAVHVTQSADLFQSYGSRHGLAHQRIQMDAESLDLDTLFEAGGNDPQTRKRVLDVVTRRVDTGLLE